MLESHFNKIAGLRPSTVWKETPTQMFFCKICQIFKSAYFIQPLQNGCFWIMAMVLKIKPIIKIISNLIILLSHNQISCGKIRTRKNPVFGHFSRSVIVSYLMPNLTQSQFSTTLINFWRKEVYQAFSLDCVGDWELIIIVSLLLVYLNTV